VEVLAAPWPAGAGPRVVLPGGDRLVTRPRPDAPFGLVNHSGPTEATVGATAGEVEARGEGPPPIGRPIPGLSTWVTDRRLRPRPPGLSGELTIGGAGLARGYRGRPAATAEAFVPDPFAEEPGARRYRTGDRVRHGADGALEFLGRLDRQVQVRGVRVEPGEIEVALAAHPGVAQAVVAVRRVDAADRLVAYLTGAGERPAAGELRSWLARRLPAAMVPSAFVFLDALPRTTRGKIDRASLPEIALADLSAGAGEAPRTPVERRLADLWSEVLGETVIGRESDFFAHGGDSLRATRMLGRVRRELDVELPLTAIFEEPTLAALAGRIEEAPAGGAARAPLPAADGEGLRRDFPLTVPRAYGADDDAGR
jgi:acyl carrier protein